MRLFVGHAVAVVHARGGLEAREHALVEQGEIAFQRGLQAGGHVAQLVSVAFGGAAAGEPLRDARHAVGVALQALFQAAGHGDAAHRMGQQRVHLMNRVQVANQDVLAHQQRGLPGQVGGDVGVAVGVAAHPGTQTDRSGDVGGAGAGRGAQTGGDRRHGVPQRRFEGAQQQARFLQRSRAAVAQMVGLPEALDVGGEPQIDGVAFGVGGVFALQQQGVDRLQRLLHGEALRFSRVGGEDGLQEQAGGGVGEGVVRDAVIAQMLGDGGDRAGLRLFAGEGAGAAAADAVGLFGGVGEQEVGEKCVADLRRQPERPAAHQLRHFGGEGGFGLAADAAPPLGQRPQLLNRAVDIGAVDVGDGAAQEVAQQAHIARQWSIDVAPILNRRKCVGHGGPP